MGNVRLGTSPTYRRQGELLLIVPTQYNLNRDDLQILMLSDLGAAWCAKFGLNMANRPARFALIIDDLVIKCLEVGLLIFFYIKYPRYIFMSTD